MYGILRWIVLVGSIRVHMSSLRRKLKATLGFDPIVNKIGEGYRIGGNFK